MKNSKDQQVNLYQPFITHCIQFFSLKIKHNFLGSSVEVTTVNSWHSCILVIIIISNLNKFFDWTSIHQKGVGVFEDHPDDRLPCKEEQPARTGLCQEVQILCKEEIVVVLKERFQLLGLVLLRDDELVAGRDVVVTDVGVVQREEARAR